MEILSKKVKTINPSYDPAMSFLGIYQKDSMFCHNDNFTPMIIAALFTRTRKWNQTRCPSSDEQIMKMWPIYKMKYFLTVKNMKSENFRKVDGTGKC